MKQLLWRPLLVHTCVSKTQSLLIEKRSFTFRILVSPVIRLDCLAEIAGHSVSSLLCRGRSVTAVFPMEYVPGGNYFDIR